LKSRKIIVLVTGATGMLGSRLVYDLILSGFKVRAIFREKSRIDLFKKNVVYYGADPETLTNSLEWVETDLLDYFGLTKALEGIELVYHCAAMVSFLQADRSPMFDINIRGTANLVNACIEIGVKKICHVSSIAALGKTDDGGLIDEDQGWVPEKKHSGYSISKFHSEMEIWRGVAEGLNAVIVNPSVIIGPGDWKNGSSAFYGQLYRGLKFYSKGVTGFVDVRDVTSAMLLLTDESNFNTASGNRYILNTVNMSYHEFFSKIAFSIGVEAPKIPVTNFMLAVAWRLAIVLGMITGNKPQITQETALSASSKSIYDGLKIVKSFGFQYRSIDSSIMDIGRIFLESKDRH